MSAFSPPVLCEPGLAPCSTICSALVWSLVAMPCALMVFGPERRFGDWRRMLEGLRILSPRPDDAERDEEAGATAAAKPAAAALAPRSQVHPVDDAGAAKGKEQGAVSAPSASRVGFAASAVPSQSAPAESQVIVTSAVADAGPEAPGEARNHELSGSSTIAVESEVQDAV